MHVQLVEDWRPLAPPAAPAPVQPPAAVHSHPVEAPLGPGEDADGVAEAGTLFCVSPPEETPHDTALADAAWIQAGIEEDISCHIAAFESAHVPQGVSADYHPPEGDPPLEDAPPFPAAPAEPPWPHDASAVAEPVSPHILPLGNYPPPKKRIRTRVGSATA